MWEKMDVNGEMLRPQLEVMQSGILQGDPLQGAINVVTSDGVIAYQSDHVNKCNTKLPEAVNLTGQFIAIQGGLHCLLGWMTTSPNATTPHKLVVFLHGDAVSSQSVDIKQFATTVAQTTKDSVVLAIARPGYFVPNNGNSSGNTKDMRDHYTPENIDAVALAINAVKDRYNLTETTIFGYSGGGVIGMNILNRFPTIAQKGFCYACPLDTVRWRQMRGRSEWYNSLNPITHMKHIPKDTVIMLVAGDGDNNSPVHLSERYAEAGKEYGLNIRVTEVEGDHGDFLSPQVLSLFSQINN
ncbi:MAG: alpha/beta hydrolase family protein [Magnetospirillum sp.]